MFGGVGSVCLHASQCLMKDIRKKLPVAPAALFFLRKAAQCLAGKCEKMPLFSKNCVEGTSMSARGGNQ